MRLALLRIGLVVVATALAVALRPAEPAFAIVHLAETHEVMAGFDGDTDVQYVEINQRAFLQNITTDSKLSVFDATGTFIDADTVTAGDQPLLTVPTFVANTGDGVRWLMGTQAFKDLPGVVDPDFVFPDNPGLTTAAGMVCLFENSLPLSPRDFTDPSDSIDCVAYGGAGFTGSNPNSFPSEAAASGPGNGTKSLTRIVPASIGGSAPWAHSDDVNDFALRCPTPEDNAGQVSHLGPDDDADGLTNCREGELGTDPNVVDTDLDGCADGEEINNLPGLGGDRDPTDYWDFYDVPDRDTGLRDKVVNIPGDILGVASRFGNNDNGGTATINRDTDPLSNLGPPPPSPPVYHPAWDRSPRGPGGITDPGPPDGTVNIPDDILGVAPQFGHSCLAAP